MPVFPLSATSTSTVTDLIEETRTHLLSGTGESINQISATDDSATAITVQRAITGITAGSVLSVGLEAIRVWEVTDSVGRTLEVLRGYQGSTPEAHAAGDLVRVNPPHTDFAIFQALNAELNALTGAGLFQVKVLDFTTSTIGVRTYDTASDLLDVIEVAVDQDSIANQWPLVKSWTLRRNMLSSEFTSGTALRIDSSVPTGRPARIVYKAKLGLLGALSDVVAPATGLEESALDLPAIGAAWRLSMPSEVQRNQTKRQGDPRRAEEVPPGAKLRAPLGLAQVRAQRIREEIANLHRKWPERR